MAKEIRRNGFGWVSLALLLAGWVWTGAFLYTGLGRLYPASWWVHTISFCSLMFAPVAGIVAVGGVLWSRRKKIPLTALALSVISTIVIVWMRL